MQEVQVLEATRTAPNSRGRVRSNPITRVFDTFSLFSLIEILYLSHLWLIFLCVSSKAGLHLLV